MSILLIIISSATRLPWRKGKVMLESGQVTLLDYTLLDYPTRGVDATDSDSFLPWYGGEICSTAQTL